MPDTTTQLIARELAASVVWTWSWATPPACGLTGDVAMDRTAARFSMAAGAILVLWLSWVRGPGAAAGRDGTTALTGTCARLDNRRSVVARGRPERICVGSRKGSSGCRMHATSTSCGSP